MPNEWPHLHALLLAVSILSIVICGIIGSVKGRAISGILLGLLMGPMGIIVVLALENVRKATDY